MFEYRIISLMSRLLKLFLTQSSPEFGIDINMNKTMYMVVNKNIIQQGQLFINQNPLETVKTFYLDSTINDELWDRKGKSL